jgi:nucleoside-diphosphate-sugar epimerase
MNNMKKAIVTGGAGFIGSNLVDRLIDDGWLVAIIDDLSTGKLENINPAAFCWQQDISTVDIDELTHFMKGADIVFHLAALARVQPSIENPIPYNEVNIKGTLNILLAAHRSGVKRVVYSASSSAYGDAKKLPTSETEPTNPLSPYGLQKYVGEQYCKMFSEVYGLDTVSLRYFNVYGERMNLEGAYCLVMGIFARQMLDGKPLTISCSPRRGF